MSFGVELRTVWISDVEQFYPEGRMVALRYNFKIVHKHFIPIIQAYSACHILYISKEMSHVVCLFACLLICLLYAFPTEFQLCRQVVS